MDHWRSKETSAWSSPPDDLSGSSASGPPLVLLPGLASTYRGYVPTLRRLARRYQTIQLDYPGEHPDDGASLPRISHDDLVDDLFGLLDQLGRTQVRLFGLSFGSTIALKALRADGNRFPKAVLQGGFARRKLMPAERIALAMGRKLSGNASRLPFHRRGLARNNKSTFPSRWPELWDLYVVENGLTPIASLTHRLDLLDRLDLRLDPPRDRARGPGHSWDVRSNRPSEMP